jgi:hypothetical protein
MGLFATYASAGVPGEICSNSDLFTNCSTAVIQKADPTGYQCLQKLLACGKYETVVNGLDVGLQKPNSIQKYFIGAAHYGLSVETTVAADRCFHVQSANVNLAQYLTAALNEFNSVGSFVSHNVAHIGHATKIVNDLSRDNKCIQESLNREQIAVITESLAHEYIKSMFFAPKKECAALGKSTGAEYLATVSCNMQDIVTMASDIETGIALRKVELVALDKHLGNAQTPGIIDDVKFISSKMNKIEELGLEMLDKTEKLKAVFLAKVSEIGISIDDLKQLAADNIRLLEELVNQASYELDLFIAFFDFNQNSLLKQLYSNLGIQISSNSVTSDRDSINKTVEDIEQLWNTSAKGDPIRCNGGFSNAWYCKLESN